MATETNTITITEARRYRGTQVLWDQLAKGGSKARLSRWLGFPWTTTHFIISGKRTTDGPTAQAIARYLEMPVDVLFTDVTDQLARRYRSVVNTPGER